LEVEAESLLRPGMSDTTLGAVIAYLEPREWAGTVGTLEGTLIAAADPDRLSLRDWHANALNGQNLWVEDGMGPLVGACLPAAPDEIWLETPVQRIAWQRPHGRVAVTTPRGTLTCKACIVTVSTGVLAAGAIRFSPDLPDLVSDAIAGLPMGLLTKVALRAAGDDRLDLPSFCSVDRPVALGEAAMFFNAWPFGHDHLVGFVGGTAAWGLARAGNKAAEDFARSELRRLFGARADRAFRPGAVVTGWGTDPLTLGAYCYARPGAAAARRVLAQPLEGGRLLFAGEACHDGLAGTTAGAMLSGQEAAGHALRALP
jgi:monoamine oxidase